MENEKNEQNWFSRNWKWFVPSSCLGLIVICTVCVGLTFGAAVVAIRSSDVYQEAVAIAQSNSQVQAALGAPIEPGLLMQGNISVENSSGEADFQVPLNGSSSSGTLYVQADRSNGVWSFIVLEVQTDSGQVINLR